MPNQNPLKSQIAANRERFENNENDGRQNAIKYNRIGAWEKGYEKRKKIFDTSQTSLLQTAIAAVEEMKVKLISEDQYMIIHPDDDKLLYDEYIAGDISWNSALSKVVDLLKGGIE